MSAAHLRGKITPYFLPHHDASPRVKRQPVSHDTLYWHHVFVLTANVLKCHWYSHAGRPHNLIKPQMHIEPHGRVWSGTHTCHISFILAFNTCSQSPRMRICFVRIFNYPTQQNDCLRLAKMKRYEPCQEDKSRSLQHCVTQPRKSRSHSVVKTDCWFLGHFILAVKSTVKQSERPLFLLDVHTHMRHSPCR